MVGFEPKAQMHTAHHLLLFGCDAPGFVDDEAQQAGKQWTWQCGHGSANAHRQVKIC